MPFCVINLHFLSSELSSLNSAIMVFISHSNTYVAFTESISPVSTQIADELHILCTYLYELSTHNENGDVLCVC